MRCFLALAIPDDVRAPLIKVQEALRRAEADVKWVEEENLHLSLKFLGDVGEEQIGTLKGLLTIEAARWPAMRLTYGGVGVFPDHGPPRTLWVGATGDLEKVAGLAAALERAAEQVGVPREGRPFVAHLTIGRVKSGRNVQRLQAAVGNQRQVPLGGDTVREFGLYRSTITSDGPIYDVLARFPLRSG